MLKSLGAASLLALSLAATVAHAETYYVSSTIGDDRSTGTSPTQPWASLSRVAAFPLQPGDEVKLMAGSLWREPLTLTRSGSENAPILVTAEGIGSLPRIDAGGIRIGEPLTNFRGVLSGDPQFTGEPGQLGVRD